MAIKTQEELAASLASLFPDNGTGEITAEDARTFYTDLIDTAEDRWGAGVKTSPLTSPEVSLAQERVNTLLADCPSTPGAPGIVLLQDDFGNYADGTTAPQTPEVSAGGNDWEDTGSGGTIRVEGGFLSAILAASSGRGWICKVTANDSPSPETPENVEVVMTGKFSGADSGFARQGFQARHTAGAVFTASPGSPWIGYDESGGALRVRYATPNGSVWGTGPSFTPAEGEDFTLRAVFTGDDVTVTWNDANDLTVVGLCTARGGYFGPVTRGIGSAAPGSEIADTFVVYDTDAGPLVGATTTGCISPADLRDAIAPIIDLFYPDWTAP
jgi:hypothetical protein